MSKSLKLNKINGFLAPPHFSNKNVFVLHTTNGAFDLRLSLQSTHHAHGHLRFVNDPLYGEQSIASANSRKFMVSRIFKCFDCSLLFWCLMCLCQIRHAANQNNSIHSHRMHTHTHDTMRIRPSKLWNVECMHRFWELYLPRGCRVASRSI